MVLLSEVNLASVIQIVPTIKIAVMIITPSVVAVAIRPLLSCSPCHRKSKREIGQ